MPIDPDAWLRWHTAYGSTYTEWCRAMDALDAALGHPVGRHPRTFRPLCEEIVAQ